MAREAKVKPTGLERISSASQSLMQRFETRRLEDRSPLRIRHRLNKTARRALICRYRRNGGGVGGRKLNGIGQRTGNFHALVRRQLGDEAHAQFRVALGNGI